MKATRLSIPEVVLIEPKVFGDARGFFFESFNQKAFNALPAEYKAILEAAAAYAHNDVLAKYDYRNPAALRQLVAGGTKLFRFPQDAMDAGFKAANALYDEISAKNPTFKKIYDDQVKARAEMNLWFRIAEAGFDGFMQQQKL